MFTLRNGNLKDEKYTKPYAEKLLITQEGQVTPCHFHWNKMEDIINRGGGELVIEVYNSTENEELADNRFYEPTGRFPEIEEDEAPLYLLGNEYPEIK